MDAREVIRALLLALALASAFAHAAPRDPAVRYEFRKANPCPSTGMTTGRCPGYHVDHIQALMLGGRDEAANMQWLTHAEHRAKTKREFAECKRVSYCTHRGVKKKRELQH